MVKPLDVFLRDHVRPLLKEKGFSKKGRDFRLVAASGDVAFISFRPWKLGLYDVEFLATGGMLPRLWIEWRVDTYGLADGSTVSPILEKRVLSPYPYLESVNPHTETWLLNANDTERIDAFLSRLSSLCEELSLLLDRQNLISVARDSATSVQIFRVARERVLAVLLVDEGPSPELDEALRALEARDPNDIVASWVRSRLATK